MFRSCTIALLFLLALTPSAAETSRQLWVRAKCALCHGMDGSGLTDAGRSSKAPDLRSPEIQKLSDTILANSIAAGHKGMPSFRKQVDAERVRLLISYIRSVAAK